MKRSEMLEIIKKVCKEWENSKVEKRMADEILTAIENEGMNPPLTIMYIDKPAGNTLCSETYDWDPEND